MTAWEIHHVPDSPIILVLRDDRTMMTSDGQPLIFYREVDAQRFIDEWGDGRRLYDADIASKIAETFIDLRRR